MMTRASNSRVVAGRFARPVTTGCLLLLIVPAVLLGYFWYSVWHVHRDNDQRRQAVLATILDQARLATSDTAHALNTSGTTDTGILTGVIWQHTHAPAITYDASLHTFAATGSRSVLYDEKKLVLPNGGQVNEKRCFTFTFSHPSGASWTATMAEQAKEVCAAGETIDSRARLAKDRIKNMAGARLSPTDVTDVLDPTHQQDAYVMKGAVRHGQTVTITLLIHAQREVSATAEQCYQFIRHLDVADTERSVTSAPLASC
ncbi:hypothetical protein ACIGXA_39715 [Streptomyces fildesensis]|uniref:Uncharacterized protein n=1 Tax=Streptomyces fildesensis TaxID=375757 RepID=A0ABW8CJL4_9ACTN